MTRVKSIAPLGRATRGQRGYALVSVIWLLGLLALAVSAMSLYSVNSLSVVASSSDGLAADALSRAGVESAVIEILRTPVKKSVRGTLQQRLAAGVARASWRGENGRADINLAPVALIASLLARFVDDEKDADKYLKVIMDRRPRQAAPGAQGLAPPQGQALGPFRHIGELTLAGLPDSLVKRLAPFITVYGSSEKINPRLASEEVLGALPDMTEARLRGLMELRDADSPDTAAWTRQAGSAAAFIAIDPGPATRIRVEAKLDNGFRSASEVVIVMFPDDREPYRILSWEDHSSASDFTSRAGDIQ